ncbi:MAG: hypothetical protein R2715_00325 [Ilumatobacteraceae bacterium]
MRSRGVLSGRPDLPTDGLCKRHRFTGPPQRARPRIFLYAIRSDMGNLQAVDTWHETHPDG